MSETHRGAKVPTSSAQAHPLHPAVRESPARGGNATTEGHSNAVSHGLDGLSRNLQTPQTWTTVQSLSRTVQPSPFCNTAKPSHPLLRTGLYSTIEKPEAKRNTV